MCQSLTLKEQSTSQVLWVTVVLYNFIYGELSNKDNWLDVWLDFLYCGIQWLSEWFVCWFCFYLFWHCVCFPHYLSYLVTKTKWPEKCFLVCFLSHQLLFLPYVAQSCHRFLFYFYFFSLKVLYHLVLAFSLWTIGLDMILFAFWHHGIFMLV